MDEAGVLRAANGLALSFPRGVQRGRTGSRRAAVVGSSIEVHEWRAYQPGDDVRSMDWNAVARTGELIVRLREDEVSPRVEVVLDASRSMAVTPDKAERAREVGALLCELAFRQGLVPTLLVSSSRPERVEGSSCLRAVPRFAFDARDDLGTALRRMPPLRRCGLRIVISDLLFETTVGDVVGALGRNASALALVQLLAPEDIAPPEGFGARLIDAETDDTLEHLLTPDVLEVYLRRLEEHQALVRASAHRARAMLVRVTSRDSLSTLARGGLFPLVVPAKAEIPWPSR